jgi:hypothetical protein
MKPGNGTSKKTPHLNPLKARPRSAFAELRYGPEGEEEEDAQRQVRVGSTPLELLRLHQNPILDPV